MINFFTRALVALSLCFVPVGAAMAQQVSPAQIPHGKTLKFTASQNWIPDPGISGAWIWEASGGGSGGGGGCIAAGQSGSGGAGGAQATYVGPIWVTAAQIAAIQPPGGFAVTVGAGGAGGAGGVCGTNSGYGNNGAQGGDSHIYGTSSTLLVPIAWGAGGGGFGAQGQASAGSYGPGLNAASGSSNGSIPGNGAFFSPGYSLAGASNPSGTFPIVLGGGGNGSSSAGQAYGTSYPCFGSGGSSGGGLNAGVFQPGTSTTSGDWFPVAGTTDGASGANGGNAFLEVIQPWPFQGCLPIAGASGAGSASSVGGAGGNGGFPGGAGGGGGSGVNGGGKGGDGAGGEVVIMEVF